MTLPTKALFLDIDGPMIPVRAYHLPGQTPIVSLFDPCATSLLNELLDRDSNIAIVISSSHATSGKQHIINLFELNGIDPNRIHPDWKTPRKMSSERSTEILWWLNAHKEITHYVAVDDSQLDPEHVPNFAYCDTYNGFSWRNYLECRLFLELFDQYEDRDAIERLVVDGKRREVYHAAVFAPNFSALAKVMNEVMPSYGTMYYKRRGEEE